MLLTYKTQIYPTEGQRQLLWALAERCRLVYNFALQERQERWKSHLKNPSKPYKPVQYIEQQNNLLALKKRYPVVPMFQQ